MPAFTVSDLHVVLQRELGPACKALQSSLAPLEYLARRDSQLKLCSLPVSALLQHIPQVLKHCSTFVMGGGSAAAGRETAHSAMRLVSKLITILSIPAVQDRLGGHKQVQHHLTRLEAALDKFNQHRSPTTAGTTDINTCDDHPYRASGAVQCDSKADSMRQNRLCLADLLAAVSPIAGQPGSPIPRKLPQLLSSWAKVVYGELADCHCVDVMALMLCHWRSLLRLLRLCLEGATQVNTTVKPMHVDTVLSLVNGLRYLLQQEQPLSQFTLEQLHRAQATLQAFVVLLSALPRTQTGQAASTGLLSSAAVALLLRASSSSMATTNIQAAPDRGHVAAAASITCPA